MIEVKSQLRTMGSIFAFEVYLEYYHDEIVEGIRQWLGPMTAEQVKQKVRQTKFPPLSQEMLSSWSGYEKYLSRIDVARLFDLIEDARPDVAEAIANMGEEGLKYMAGLREHILQSVANFSKPPKPPEDMVMLRCDNCEKSWPVARSQAASVGKCPFCGHGRDEPADKLPHPSPDKGEGS